VGRNAHLLTYGEQPSGVVILERRYGPRRLRNDDDDDGEETAGRTEGKGKKGEGRVSPSE